MKKTRIIISIVLILSLSTLFFACNKKKPETYTYTQNNTFGFDKIDSLKTLNTSNLISPDSAFNLDTGNIFIIQELGFLIVKVKYPTGAEKYGLYDYDGKKIYDTVYDLIDYSFGTLRLYKEGSWTLRNYTTKKETTFVGGFPHPLYNNLIAYFPIDPSYKIEIYDYDKSLKFTIYDSKRDNFDDVEETNKLVNYGNYIVYRNDELKLNTVYDISGKILFEIPLVVSSKFYYIGNDKFINSYATTTGEWKYRTLLYSISDRNNYKEIATDDPIVEIYSRQENNIPVADGFRLAVTTTGQSLIISGLTDDSGELTAKNVPSLSPYTREQDGKLHAIDKDNKDKLYIYNGQGEKQSEIFPIYGAVVNNGYVVAGYPTESIMKFGIFLEDSTNILDYTYDYLSPVVDGVAYGYNNGKSARDPKTFYKVTVNGAKVTTAETKVNGITGVSAGVYFSFVSGVLKCYNFNDQELFEATDVNNYDVRKVSNNKAVIVVIEKANGSHIYVLK